MQTANTMDAITTPPRGRFPAFARRYQAHNPATGKNESREVLFSAAMPQSKPNQIHGNGPSRSSSVSTSQKIVARSSADRLVSHTQRVHQKITFGSSAHAHADPTATFSEKIRRAIRKIGTQVRAENKLFSASSTKADAFV